MIHVVLAKERVLHGKDVQTVCGKNLKFSVPEKPTISMDLCTQCESYAMTGVDRAEGNFYLVREAEPESKLVTADEQSARVEELHAECLTSMGSQQFEDSFEELRKIARSEHAYDCALGATPACTCGIREAQEYVDQLTAATHGG